LHCADCGIDAFAIVGVATEIGIEPTVRHRRRSGLHSVLITDACGAGHQDAAARAIASPRIRGDAVLTDVEGHLCSIPRMLINQLW